MLSEHNVWMAIHFFVNMAVFKSLYLSQTWINSCLSHNLQTCILSFSLWNQVMESKGRKGQYLYNKKGNVTLNTKAKWLHWKRTSKKHCVNGVTRFLTSQVGARAHWNHAQQVRSTSKTVNVNSEWHYHLLGFVQGLVLQYVGLVVIRKCVWKLVLQQVLQEVIWSLWVEGFIICMSNWVENKSLKIVVCPWKVLEKYLKRKVSSL